MAVAAAVGSGSTSPAALDVSIGAGPVSVSVGVGDSSSPAPQQPSEPEPSPEPPQEEPDDQPDTSTSDVDGAGDAGQIPVRRTAPGGGNAVQRSGGQARTGQQTAVLNAQDVAEPSSTGSRFDSLRTHDGDMRLLAIRDDDERLEALLALVNDCPVGEIDLAALVDDRRITIIDLRDIFEEPGLARLQAVLRAGAPGRKQTIRAVQGDDELQAVLAREGIAANEVVALQVGESGMTEVFVLPDSDSMPAGGVIPPMPPPLQSAVEDCPVNVEVATLEPQPKEKRSVSAPVTTGSIRAPAMTERIGAPVTAEPPAMSETGDGELDKIVARLNDFDDVEASTEAAVEVGILLDRVAWIDSSLLCARRTR
jgi:hypothetical protein